jgi:hypothetical protein
MDYNLSIVVSFTVAEFRQFKVALRTLQAAGMYQDAAVTLLVAAVIERRRIRNERRYSSTR